MENTVAFPGLGLEFTFQNALHLGPVTITFYGIIIAVGLLLAMVYAYSNFRKVGVDPDRATDAILGGVIGGVLGARIYYVAFSWSDFGLDFSSWDAFWNTFSRLFKTWEGGMAIYGGLIGALLVGLLIAKWRKIKIRPLLDVVGVGFLLGQGIGRWGNFFNVEAFGGITTMPWGMASPRVYNYLYANADQLNSIGMNVDLSNVTDWTQVAVHPTFFYESVWCLLGFALLALYMKRRKFDGEVFLLYLAWYGAERFIVEGLRTDSLMVGTLRVSQLLSGLLVVAAILAIILIRSKIRGAHDENYMKLFVLTEDGQKIARGIREESKNAEPVSEAASAKEAAGEGTASGPLEAKKQALETEAETAEKTEPLEKSTDSTEEDEKDGGAH